MKKRVSEDFQRNKINTKVVFITIFIIVILVALYLAFISPTIQFSSISTLSLSNAISVAQAIGIGINSPATDWYCGRKSTFIDNKGNKYSSTDLASLKAVLGNDYELKKKFCIITK